MIGRRHTLPCAHCGFVQSPRRGTCGRCGRDPRAAGHDAESPSPDTDWWERIAPLLEIDERLGAAQTGGLGLLLLAMVWLGWGYATKSPLSPSQWSPSLAHHLLSMANLVFHEAGHWIFAFLGRFMAVLGGSLTEIGIPVLCAVTFIRAGNNPGGAFATWWAGQAASGLSAYVADARAQRLVLLGGHTGADRPGTHDWNNLLRWTGLLELDHSIAWTLHLAGVTLMIAGATWCAVLFWTAVRPAAARTDRAAL